MLPNLASTPGKFTTWNILPHWGSLTWGGAGELLNVRGDGQWFKMPG